MDLNEEIRQTGKQTYQSKPGEVITASTSERNMGSEIKINFKLGDGLLDVDALSVARSDGHTDAKITEAASKQNLQFSDSALNSLGLSKYILRQYGGQEVEGVFAIGLAAVERARAAGVKDAEIVAYSKLQGIRFGEQALASLGLNKYILMTHGGSTVDGIRAIGLAAVNRMRAAGVKDSEIITYGKLQGVRFGTEALTSLGLSKYILRNYGGGEVDGVTGIDLAAVERAKAAGLSNQDVIAYAKLQGIYFGERALAYLGI